MIDRARTLDLFRRHVMRRPDHVLGAGQAAFLRRHPNDFRNAEVRDLYPAIQVDQNVFRLDVAMHDAVVMRKLQGFADLRHDRQGLIRSKPTGPLHFAQVGPAHIFHDQVMQVARFPEFMNGDNVRMRQFGEGPRFAIKAFSKPGRLSDLGRQDLQRYQSIQRLLPRFVNCAHPALTDEGENLQRGKEFRDFLDGWRVKTGLYAARLSSSIEASLEQAGRAKLGLHIWRHRFLATRADSFSIHSTLYFQERIGKGCAEKGK